MLWFQGQLNPTSGSCIFRRQGPKFGLSCFTQFLEISLRRACYPLKRSSNPIMCPFFGRRLAVGIWGLRPTFALTSGRSRSPPWSGQLPWSLARTPPKSRWCSCLACDSLDISELLCLWQAHDPNRRPAQGATLVRNGTASSPRCGVTIPCRHSFQPPGGRAGSHGGMHAKLVADPAKKKSTRLVLVAEARYPRRSRSRGHGGPFCST